jgi:hypothetical protein
MLGRNFMSREFLILLLTAVFVAVPAVFGPATPLGFSGSASAQTINYNSSKSNTGNLNKNISDGAAKGQATEGTLKPAKGKGTSKAKTYNSSHSNTGN